MSHLTTTKMYLTQKKTCSWINKTKSTREP